MSIQNKNYDVVILTHAPKDELLVSIDRLLNQSIKPTMIVIYNTDESIFYTNITDKESLKKYVNNDNTNGVNIRFINIEKNDFDHGKARNDSAKLGKSEYILFMTDDAIPANEKMAENLMGAFVKYDLVDHKVAVAYARQIAKENAALKEKYVREFNYPDYDIVKEKSKEEELGIKNYYCSNVCAMYDRKIFEILGGFEENLILNEDTFYVYDAINKGYRIVYKSDAEVFHSHDLTYKEQFSRNFDIGVSQCQKKEIFSKIPSTKEGKKFAKKIATRLLKEFHPILAIDFLIECLYRYRGFKKGMNYESLSNEECIECANNKHYFINKRNSYVN